jgi:uncharacterized surface protein with fasciclin (FAS1) repeats
MTPIRGEHASGLLLHHFVRNNSANDSTVFAPDNAAFAKIPTATVHIIDTVLMPPPPDRTSRLR